MEVLATNVRGLSFDACQSLLYYMGKERQERIRKFRNQEDAIRSLFGELLIRVYAAENWGIAHRECIVLADGHQKPQFVNFPRCQFNVSHSGSWVVAAFDESPIGIDIEQIIPIDLTVANRFFTAEEVKQLENRPVTQRLAYFYRLWTLKESYLKANGKGLSVPLDSFGFDLTEGAIRFHSSMDSKTWSFKHYSIDSAYKLAVCGYSSEARFPAYIQITSPEKIVCCFQRVVEMS
ncbi:MAG: 4'-phosphopantetheinyl transferase superfamily protein [Firmicutes bacterium]|nr:4'-phosphopantetheinyl transferase superfamily protein [Bacillota bacterium]